MYSADGNFAGLLFFASHDSVVFCCQSLFWFFIKLKLCDPSYY